MWKLCCGNGFFNFALIVALHGATILKICTKKRRQLRIPARHDAG
jgi:hypothetical protein